jgi:hypothetical protein
MQYKNWVPTLGGYFAALGAIPVTVGTIANQFPSIHVHVPPRLYGICVFLGALSIPMIGFSAKGKDEHSTASEVQESTKKASQ